MTYLVVKSEGDNIRFTYNDGGCASDNWVVTQDTLKEFCEDRAQEALEDGNYYTGIGVGNWNKKKREYVSSRWKNLTEIINNQLSKGKVNIEIMNYFSPTGEKGVEPLISELEKLVQKIKDEKYPIEKLIKLIDFIEEEK